MIVDLLHNKIVKDTMTTAFSDSVHTVLVPMLEEKYGDTIERIAMYEDYIADGFLYSGEWYYPLTVKFSGADDSAVVWIKWTVNKKNCRNNIPYAYIGQGSVDFQFAGFVPNEFADKLLGRAIDYDPKAIKLKVEAVTDDPLLLCGKYSQSFIDEMAKQITKELERALAIEGLDESSMELQLVFAPATYLEHTSENVTYRRLLLTDKGCQPRDFWVKWTRLDGVIGYKLSEHVGGAQIRFELGEDVSQKIREKEYRFLCNANPSKYQSAMGKKTVTEWRDIIKRAIKRGDIVKIETSYAMPIENKKDDVTDQLKALLGSYGYESAAPKEEPKTDDNDIIAALTSVLDEQDAEPATLQEDELDEVALVEPVFEPITDSELSEDDEELDEAEELTVELVEEPEAEELTVELVEELDEPADEPADEQIDVFAAASMLELDEEAEELTVELVEEPDEADEPAEVLADEPAEPEYEPITYIEPKPQVDEDAIRREIEARLRLEYETEARLRAEREAEQLRLEHERLVEENERLARIAKEAELKRIAEEEERRRKEEEERLKAEEARRLEEERQRELEAKAAEEARMRAAIEAQMRLEAKERERVAEAARMAVEEQKRLEAERAEREEREKQEAIRREAERLHREEQERRAREQKRLEEQKRIEAEEQRKREEEEARARLRPVNKRAKLMFRYTVDLNVVKRIKEVVEETLIANHKEKLNIRIKASPCDNDSIVLDITLPENEMDTLVNMMKALGSAKLGITKIILE